MIVTLSAALMYIERVNPKASLHQAWRALHLSPAIARFVRPLARGQYRTRDAHVVCRGGRVVEAWPLSVVVSGGPLR